MILKTKIFYRFLVFLLLSLSTPTLTYSQTKSSVSANCGKCGKSVSPFSKVGDVCPHCGVRWGKENTSTSTIKENISSTENINPFAINPGTYTSPTRSDYQPNPFTSESQLSEPSTVIRSCKLRAASNYSSEVLLTIPKNADILIEKRKGDWVKIFYISNLRPVYGWIHSSNVIEQ